MLHSTQAACSPHYLSSELKQSKNNIFSNLANGLASLTKYILNNLGKAMTLVLAGQVIVSSALGKAQNPSTEQRVVPALNLTWLNQTDANQRVSIPAWLRTSDTHVDDGSHRVKRSLDALLGHILCFQNVEYHEYLYVAGTHHKDNLAAGRAFTWNGNDQDRDMLWILTKTNGSKTFYLRNQYHNSFLYDTNVQGSGDYQRFIAKVGSVFEQANKWEVRESINPGIVVLWNDWTRRALYASGDRHDRNRRYVFTWPGLADRKKSLWYIEICSHNNRQRRAIPDKLEATTSLEEKENVTFSDNVPTKFSFFQIRPSNQGKINLESVSNSDRSHENQTRVVKCGF